ncbi:MAG TPA: hypothetical protein EYP85_09260 [Armatimonadetes bacterium]|nr:hypothetical protein [Armatimonadota bacterium]
MDALVLAGGKLEGTFAQLVGLELKALLEFGGRTLLEIAVAALRGCERVERIAVSGPPEIEPAVQRAQADLFVKARETVIGTVRWAAEQLAVEGPFLLSASDLPLLASADFDALTEQIPDTPAVGYTVVSREPFEREFPAHPKRFIHLADGDFRGGGAAVVHTTLLAPLEPLLQASFEARKSMTHLARLVGPKVFLQFVLSQFLGPRFAPTSEAIRQQIERKLGCPALLLRGTPGLGFDVDKPADWEYLKKGAEGSGEFPI